MSSSPSPIERVRHSLAHLLAAAIQEQHPDVKLAIGPAIDTGFYYDIELSQPLSTEDLPAIEQRMRELAQEGLSFTREDVPIDEAIQRLQAHDQPYKIEIAQDLQAEGETTVSFYTSGPFVDLCRGGHVESTNDIVVDAFMLDRVAGAYWRGDASRPMLQRIYGLAFNTKKELKAHLAMREQAKQRDHRVIGPARNLYRMSPEVGPGLPIMMKDGMVIWNRLIDHLRSMMRKYYRNDVQELHTPHIGSQSLYELSGHWDKYKDDNFPPMQLDDRAYMMKPMNCPHHIQAFAHVPRSYRELPWRTFEIATVYRLEQSGELSGLTRVRSITQDDGHIFVANAEHIKQEVHTLLQIMKETYERLGLRAFRASLSVRDPKTPEKYIGNPKNWAAAETALEEALRENDAILAGQGVEREEGEAAFYGPKIDVRVQDALGREHQVATIQLDYNLPERFDLHYIGEDGKKHRPIMLHRAIYGSMERFMALYIEHTGGDFPTWLAPTQVSLLPVNSEMIPYAESIAATLFDAHVRVSVDTSNESVGKKIKNAVASRVPYSIVLGEQEQSSGQLPVRTRGSRDTTLMRLSALIETLHKEDDAIRPDLVELSV